MFDNLTALQLFGALLFEAAIIGLVWKCRVDTRS